MQPTELLFKQLLKNNKLGKYTTVEQVCDDVAKLCVKLGVYLTKEQEHVFATQFYKKHVFSENIDDLFEEPEDEIEKLLKKLDAYKAKLETNPENRISIMSMMSKIRKKLRDLGYDVQVSKTTQSDNVEDLKARLEQLELDLALCPVQKRKSVQSMISKIKRKLRELGAEGFAKVETKVKSTPAQLIGLDEADFDIALANSPENDWDNMHMSEPFNKLIILFLLRYSKEHDINLPELAKFVFKYRKNIFNETYTNNTEIAAEIEKQTLKNLINGVKSTSSLASTEIDDLYLNLPEIVDAKLIKKLAKCSKLSQAQKIISKI